MPVIIPSEFGMETVGIVMMFIMIATATVMLVYNSMTRLVKDDDDEKEEKEIIPPARKAINTAVSSIALVVYLALSFITGAWHITWVIFIISSLTKKLVKAIFELKEVLQ